MPARHLVWSKLRGQTPEPGRLTGSSPRTCHGSQAEREKTWRSKQAVDDELCRRAALGTARREACAWLGHGTGSRWRAFQQRGRPDRRADGSEVKAGQGRRRRMEAQGRGEPGQEQNKQRYESSHRVLGEGARYERETSTGMGPRGPLRSCLWPLSGAFQWETTQGGTEASGGGKHGKLQRDRGCVWVSWCVVQAGRRPRRRCRHTRAVSERCSAWNRQSVRSGPLTKWCAVWARAELSSSE